MVVTTTTDANTLAEDLLCEGSASFTVSWHGDVVLSRTLSVSNGSTLKVAASSDSTDADTGAVVTGDGTSLLFEADLGSTISLTGLTLYGGDGALRVTGGSFVEVIDCNFTKNNRTSSDLGGGLTRLTFVIFATTHPRPLAIKKIPGTRIFLRNRVSFR